MKGTGAYAAFPAGGGGGGPLKLWGTLGLSLLKIKIQKNLEYPIFSTNKLYTAMVLFFF